MSSNPPRPAPIVKLGGSLFGSPALDALLDVAVRHGVLVVAGGGMFADHVRTAQQTFGFGEAAAHRMAILAMDQSACLIADRRPELAACSTLSEIRDAAASGRAAIWSPSTLALSADLPASWEVTSDSLALWLAIETGATWAAMVKSASVAADGDAEIWAQAELVDRHFPVLAKSFAGALVCVGDASAVALDAALTVAFRAAA